MSPPAENGSSPPQTWSARLMGVFTGPASSGSSGERTDPAEILPPEERKAAMSTLDPMEAKWALRALVLATIAGIAIPIYTLAVHKVTKQGQHTITVGPDAILLYGAILLFCGMGYLGLWKRKRTFVAFSLFLVGFGLTVSLTVVGFAFILLGGWLMLRAWRLNKYGTTNSKAIAREAAARPRGRQGKEAARSTSKASASPESRKPPTASKRYTPKTPPRKKIPKATE